MAVGVIKSRRIRLFPEDPDLSERSLVFSQRWTKTETLPFEDPYASYALVRFVLLLVVYGWLFVYASCTFLA